MKLIAQLVGLMVVSQAAPPVLGHLLARRAGVSYESLVKERFAAPLEMTSTAVTLTDDLRRASGSSS
jgi:CubicO group peptidase (beta-lactamase class C family)